MLNPLPFNPALLRESLAVTSAEILQLEASSRLPVNRTNRARMLRQAALKQAQLEFITFNLGVMYGQDNHLSR